MSYYPVKKLSTVLVILMISVSLESSAEGLQVNDSSGTRRNYSEAEIYTKALVLQINLFVVTFPCVLLFTFVFVCYIGIINQQRLHGWIVLALSGSFALRFWIRFLTHLPVLFFAWEFKTSYQEVCVTFGRSFSYNLLW